MDDQNQTLIAYRLEEQATSIHRIESKLDSLREASDQRYATKDDMSRIEKRVNTIYAFSGAVLLALTSAAVIAFFRVAGGKL